MTTPTDGDVPAFATDVPTSARMYDYCLGGKDNFEVDRAASFTVFEQFPDGLDAARNNRLFLYRLVRFLARDAGIRQFLDMGSGLPTQNNVHQVAQQFQPDARVVYVDNDPIVLSHGRALLATDDSTTVISADIRDPGPVLTDPEVDRLVDFSQPVAVLFLSIGHSVVDDEVLRRMLATVVEKLAPGSYLAFTQLVAVDQEVADEANAVMRGMGVEWKNRVRADVDGFLDRLRPVEPGLVDITSWRPDPHQPQLAPVDPPLHPYVGASAGNQRFMEYGGVVHVP